MKKKFMDSKYNDQFYSDLTLNRKSAEIIAPIVLEYAKLIARVDEISVVDFGCGTGEWLEVYKSLGCAVLGIDGDIVKEEKLKILKSEFMVFDLKKEVKLDNKFTIASCLEVAEHLEEQYADKLIDSLTDCADIIVFSAAIPFQKGVHHVNCQWPQYWISKFNIRGYIELDCIRKRIWEKDVQDFYANNIFLFIKNDLNNNILQNLSSENTPQLYNIVNPKMWENLCDSKIMKLYNFLYNHFQWLFSVYTFFSKRR